MRRGCRVAAILFAMAWLAALGLLAVGTWGLFGQERDPLSGVFLLPLGLPWVLIADAAGVAGPWAVTLAPGVNLALILGLCRALGRQNSGVS